MVVNMWPLKVLISVEELHERFVKKCDIESDIVVLDVAFDASKSLDGYQDMYRREHIPGSKFFDLHAYVSGSALIPRELPAAYQFTKMIRSLGIGKETEVVVYDHGKPETAARAWWTLRLFGHNKVAVLDGGLRKWQADGYEVISGDTPVETTSDFELHLNADLIRDLEDIQTILETQSTQILDTRSEPFFSGEKRHSDTLPGGHIPGSKNVPLGMLFKVDGTYKSTEDLKQLLLDQGIDLNKPMVSSCRTGMTACCLAVAALLLGKPDVPVYYGSWMEWAQRVNTEEELINK